MKSISARNKGLIIGAVMIASKLFFFYGLGLPVVGKNDLIVYGIAAVGIIWSLLSFRQKAEDNHRFKDYFNTGFRTFMMITLLMVIFTFIFFKVNTAYRDDNIKTNSELLLKEGNHTPYEIEENANNLRTIFMPMMLSRTAGGYLILGALVTLIGAGFLSVKRGNV